MEYRSESKYIIEDYDAVILENRLNKIMSYDNIAKYKKYNVRSVYFDSIDNICFYENNEGISERFKMRIRVYNSSTDDIKLEYKYKKNGYTKKLFCKIDKEICNKLLSGKKLTYIECNNQVLKKIYLEQQINHFVPKILVEYERIALIEKIGNVRVTFDMNIRASKYVNRLFETNTYSRPILNSKNCILEIKYDELLPNYISCIINTKKLAKTAFSKYYLSRLEFKEEIL